MVVIVRHIRYKPILCAYDCISYLIAYKCFDKCRSIAIIKIIYKKIAERRHYKPSFACAQACYAHAQNKLPENLHTDAFIYEGIQWYTAVYEGMRRRGIENDKLEQHNPVG